MTRQPHIRIVTPVYPRPCKPESGRFVANMAEGWVAQGTTVDVISPTTLSERLKARRNHDAHNPRVTTHLVPTLGTPFGAHLPAALHGMLLRRHNSAILERLRTGPKPSLIYAQFAQSAQLAHHVGHEQSVPYFVALGESYSLLSGSDSELEARRASLRGAAGIVCVSPRLESEAIALGAAPERVTLIPNIPNGSVFKPLNKTECRRKLGLDPAAFIAVYVGHYYERKGASRLNTALKRMKRPVQAAFLGSGPLVPDFRGTIRTGSVSHPDLALWLNAADVLALPTLAEGCCNAIAEALACACPVVTSDIADVRWQVPEKGVVLVDPYDIDALAGTLDALAAAPERVARMRSDLKLDAKGNHRRSRPAEVLSWMKKTLDQDGLGYAAG